jgi:hypothetical protein
MMLSKSELQVAQMQPESDMAMQTVNVPVEHDTSYLTKNIAFQNLPWKTVSSIILKLFIVAGGIAIGMFLGLMIGFATGLIEFRC